MSYRFFTSVGVLAVVIAVVLLLAVPIAGQGPTGAARTPAAAKTYTTPKTPWGDPDLQGIWNNATSTPLQRPAALGEKAELTEDEAAEYQEEVATNLTRDRRDGGPEADVNRAYNDHWMDAKRLNILSDRRTSLIVDPPDGRIPALVSLSPERQKRRAERGEANRRFVAGMPEHYLDFSLPVRCIIRTDSPPYLGGIYNNTYQIFQSPGYVTILVEMIHSARVIPVDGRPHIGSALRQWLGDTRGRWEGNTLVVETTNFRTDDGVTYQNSNPDTFRITERFTRVDANTLHYEFTVEDPMTWTKPWSARIPWTRTNDQLYEYACHEDNYDFVHLLHGARVREASGETVAPPTAQRPGGGGDDR